MTTEEFEVNRPEVISETLEGEAVIIGPGNGTNCSPSPTASLAWGLVEDGANRATIRAGIHMTAGVASWPDPRPGRAR